MLSPLMEKAWRIDEGIRIQHGIARHEKREFWRKRILDADECNLSDYARPIKAIPQVKKSFSIVKMVRSVLP